MSILRADHTNQARRDSKSRRQPVYAGVVRNRAGDDTVPLGNAGAALPVYVDRLALELSTDRPHDRRGDVFGLSNPGPVQGCADRAFEVFGDHAALSHKTQKTRYESGSVGFLEVRLGVRSSDLLKYKLPERRVHPSMIF